MDRRLALLLAVLAAPPAAAQPAPPPACDNCGRVESVRTVQESAVWTPLGAMGLAGAGRGDVKTAYNFSTGNVVLLGAAGGAGYVRRPQAYERPRWEVVVRMDAGGTRALFQGYEPSLRVGDRVRVFGTQVELAD